MEISYTVPPFEVVVETWQNKDPAKGYALFRQFIVDWDQQDKLTDNMLIAYLIKWPGADRAIFDAWAEHMKIELVSRQTLFVSSPNSVN